MAVLKQVKGVKYLHKSKKYIAFTLIILLPILFVSLPITKNQSSGTLNQKDIKKDNQTTASKMDEKEKVIPKTSVIVPDKYPTHNVYATIFGIGEKADASNDFITNEVLAWDSKPVARFGGVDDLSSRNSSGLPITFVPGHNPFYFALPAGEFNQNGLIPNARQQSPWSAEAVAPNQSLFKGRWIEVKNPKNGKVIYAQWVDVGPNEEGDYSYVFGKSDSRPKNTFGLKAGLDLSPTASHNLGFSLSDGGAQISWKFIDAEKVPAGPWKNYPAIDNKIYW